MFYLCRNCLKTCWGCQKSESKIAINFSLKQGDRWLGRCRLYFLNEMDKKGFLFASRLNIVLLTLIPILPLSQPLHSYYLSLKSSPSLRMETSPLRRTQCWLWPASSPRHFPPSSSAGSSQWLVEPNKGNPLMAVIVCSWQVRSDSLHQDYV